MEGFIILIGFIQFIVLCMFFQLVGDLRALRKKFDSKNTDVWLERFYKSNNLGRDDEALYNLQEYIWLMINKNKSQSNYDQLKQIWDKSFIDLKSEFPEYPFQ